MAAFANSTPNPRVAPVMNHTFAIVFSKRSAGDVHIVSPTMACVKSAGIERRAAASDRLARAHDLAPLGGREPVHTEPRRFVLRASHVGATQPLDCGPRHDHRLLALI